MPGDETFVDDDDAQEDADNQDDGENLHETQEYVKKEFVARPYVSPFGTENDVLALTP
jgi:hypothetical protein